MTFITALYDNLHCESESWEVPLKVKFAGMKKSMLKEFELNKETPCITIITSTELKSFADKEKLQLKFKNIINDVKLKLESNIGVDKAKKLTRKIQELFNNIDVDHLEAGVGIYVSPGFEKLISMPFEVVDRVSVENTFDVTEIKKALDKMIDYAVLVLSKNKTRLFSGLGKSLTEIRDENFPQNFENEFQVHRASTHSFYNGEESKIDQARVNDYFRKIDGLLKNYIAAKPVVVLGVIKNLTDFMAVSKHEKQMIAKVTGNYDKHTIHEVQKIVWPEMEEYLNEKSKTEMIS